MDPLTHYSREEVASEIAGFLRGRWAAVARGPLWVRWDEEDRPLRVSSPEDVRSLAKRYSARAFYGTIEVFRRLDDRADVMELYEFNVDGADSFIDIDVTDESRVGEAWRLVVEAARIIVEWLGEKGVREGVYLLWSGAGMHVRVNRLSLQDEQLDLHPLERSYLLAEYTIRSCKDRLQEVADNSGGLVKIENVVGRNRLFTAPLSLHRRLPLVAVPLLPEMLEEFSPEWAKPGKERYEKQAWRRGRIGEASGLLREALSVLGRTPERTLIGPPPLARGRPRHRPAAPRGARVGRFPVMGLLQAARYYLLTGDLEKAKSFGLNRAIFYAYLKYHGPARSTARIIARYGGRRVDEQEVRLKPVPGLEERAPVSESGWYAMGGVEQRPEDFDRNIARRFEEAGIPFEEAWRAALDYVSRFPKHVLRDPQKFYKLVYEPVRDMFIEKVLMAKPEAPRRPPEPLPRGEGAEKRREKKTRTLLDWLKKGQIENRQD